MVLVIEIIVLCLFFTLLVYIWSKDPIKTLYNYPPKIQERVKSLKQYQDKIPTNKNKISAKLLAAIIFTFIIALLLRYVNNCTNFKDTFLIGYLLWTVVNLYDALILDIIWFCHDNRFVIEGTEDMIDDYHDYLFHLKGFVIGQVIGLVVCFLAALIVHYIL